MSLARQNLLQLLFLIKDKTDKDYIEKIVSMCNELDYPLRYSKINVKSAINRLESLNLVKVYGNMVKLTDEGSLTRRRLMVKMLEDFNSEALPKIIEAFKIIDRYGLYHKKSKDDLKKVSNVISRITIKHRTCILTLTIVLCEVYGKIMRDILMITLVGSMLNDIKDHNTLKKVLVLTKEFLSL